MKYLNIKLIGFFFINITCLFFKKKIKETFKRKPTSYYGYTKKLAEDYIIKNLRMIKHDTVLDVYLVYRINIKKKFLVADLKKIKYSKKIILLKNLNHFRDFISTKDLAEIIIHFHKKRIKGIVNLGTGNAIHLKKIAKILAKKYKKKVRFENNINPTYLIANTKKLKTLYKYSLQKKLKNEFSDDLSLFVYNIIFFDWLWFFNC